MMTTIAILAAILAAAIGYIFGKVTSRPAAPDISGLIEMVQSHPDPDKALYMIVRKVSGGKKHIHTNPTPSQKKSANPAVSGVDE